MALALGLAVFALMTGFGAYLLIAKDEKARQSSESKPHA